MLGSTAKDTVCRDWDHLHHLLFEESLDVQLQRHRSSWAFRGLSNSTWDLQTSLARLGHEDSTAIERHLLRNFRKYAHRGAVPADSVWNWLALAQHHGLPTRLLDWTFSPYVALHFATQLPHQAEDAVVWCVNMVEAKAFLPKPLKKILKNEGAHVFTAELLSRAAHTLSELDGLAVDPFVLFFEPPSLDDRIVNQYAMFSMTSDPNLLLSAWLRAHPKLFRRIIIPAALKWEVRDKLDQCNISERVLETGLDGLSHWLRRHYSPKTATPNGKSASGRRKGRRAVQCATPV